jgi:dipeptidyl aminopeptidase/acylaminoacyl peptidase
MHLDGTGVSPGNGLPMHDVFQLRADGALFLGVAVAGAHSAIATSNTDGSGLALLTDGSARDTLPAYSPAGGRILFVRRFTDNSGSLLTIPASGGTTVDLLPDSLSSTAPPISASWSPDGTQIAFARTQDADTSRDGTFLIAPGSSGLRRISGRSCEDFQWTPDGQSLICLSAYWVVRMSRSGFAIDTLSPIDDYTAVLLAHDGNTLLVQRGDGSIFLLDPDTRALTGLVVTRADANFQPIVVLDSNQPR